MKNRKKRLTRIDGILLLSLLLFFSCTKLVDKGTYTYNSKVVSRHHEDEKTVLEYHFGYSISKGKTCYHFGPNEHPEENVIYYEFLGDTLERNDKELFNKDSLIVTYTKVFLVEKDDMKFDHNKIISIE